MTQIQETTWKPATNDFGYALGKFMGVAMEQRINDKTNEQYDRLVAMFAVEGFHGEVKPIPQRMSPKFDEKNRLGELAKAFGFSYKPETKTNEKGLQICTGDNLAELGKYISAAVEKEFKFKMSQLPDKPGLWTIDFTTLNEVEIAEKETVKAA